jgi:NADH-quinone oxidoreductase subunit M
MSVAMFSSLGLPGLNGFIGEFLIFKGSFALAASFAAIAVLGLLFTAITFMRAMQKLFSGPATESCRAFPDLLVREKFIIIPVSLIMFLVGIAPQFLFSIFNRTVVQLAQIFG